MRWIPCVAAATMLLGGCGWADGSDDPPPATDGQAMCWATVRFEGTLYRAWVENPKQTPGTKIGTADLADCDDLGKDAKGPYFPPDPRQADVSAVDNYPASKVIGVHQPDGFTVYVAVDVPTKRAEAIAAKLKGS